MYPTGKSEEVRTDISMNMHHQSPYFFIIYSFIIYSLEQGLLCNF